MTEISQKVKRDHTSIERRDKTAFATCLELFELPRYHDLWSGRDQFTEVEVQNYLGQRQVNFSPRETVIERETVVRTADAVSTQERQRLERERGSFTL